MVFFLKIHHVFLPNFLDVKRVKQNLSHILLLRENFFTNERIFGGVANSGRYVAILLVEQAFVEA